MSIQTIFPSTELSDTEAEILASIFSNPVVKKYLKVLALEDTKELLALSALSKTNEELVKAHAIVQGKLSIISTLLSIQPINKE